MIPDKNHIGWTLATGAFVIASGLGLTATFAIWTATSWLEFPQFVIAVAFLFVIPGNQIIRWCRLHLSPLEHITLSAVLGMITTCWLYAGLAWLDIASLLYLWIVVAAAGLGSMWWSLFKNVQGKLLAIDRTHFLLLVAFVIAWLPMYLLAFYYRNLAWTGTGGLSYSPGVPDVLLHTSLAAELSHAVPPQIPFLAGEPLSYHVGMDLVAAVLHRYGGVAIPDLVVRFCPTMFITIDVMAVFCVARRFVGSGAAAVVAAVLATLGEDFSFIPGILQNSDSIWSVQFFAAPTVFSLYFVNPTVMAHGLLFAALFCLQRSLADHGWGWIIAASLCSAALVQTKIFFFVQLILALWIALAWNLIVLRRWIFLRQCAVIIPMSVPFILYTVVANNNGAQISWMWSSGLENYVHPAFQASNWPWLVAHSIAGLMVYLALTYGFRLIGLGELIGSFRLSRARSFHLLLAVFVVLGPLLTLTSKLVPRANPEAYNNAIWFMVASKYVTTLFAVAALTRFWSWLGWTGRSLMTAVTAVVSFASTIQYLHRLSSFHPPELTSRVVETIDFLNREARPGQVAISRLEDPILALTALRIPYYVHFADFVANPDVVVSRRQDTEEFWRSWMHGTIREDLLAKYGVEWIVASRQETPAAIGEPSVIKLGKLEIEHGFGNGQLMVYRVRTVQR